MDGMEAVLDADVDVLDEVVEGDAAGAEEISGADGDGRKGSRDFRDALKAWEATPEGAKFAKQARGDHFRLSEMNTLEPGGITALRDTYALIESMGGREAITQMQERVGAADATDQALASGDPKVFESMGEDFNAGLAKLAPAYLDRVMKSDPTAYAAAILPHLMSSLAGSALVGDLNKIVDVLGAAHLDEPGKIKEITGLLGRIGAWYAENEKKAGELKTAPANQQRTELDQERSKFEVEQQAAHWKNNIAPQIVSYERSRLDEFFKPYDTRLKLDAPAKADLFNTFKANMTAAANADPAYLKQMAIYRKQKNPDPATVTNFVKSAINRHSKTVVENAVKARYGRFLGGTKPKPAPVPGARTAATTDAVAPTVVAVRPAPAEVDYRRTSEADQYKGIYTLLSGKKVQVRKA